MSAVCICIDVPLVSASVTHVYVIHSYQLKFTFHVYTYMYALADQIVPICLFLSVVYSYGSVFGEKTVQESILSGLPWCD